MIVRSLLALLPGPIIGILVVFVIFPGLVHENLLLKFFLGIGAGFGIVSCVYFGWSLILSPEKKGFLLVESFIFLLFVVLLVARIKKGQLGDNPFLLPTRIHWISWILLVLFLGALVGWGVSYREYSFMFPHGTFDAYAIWNLRARMIFRGGYEWREAFSPQFNWKTHPDYPLLTPTNIARAWELLGTETTRVPIVLSGLFTISLIGLLFVAIALLRSTGQASLSSLLLLTTPWIPFFATAQNAEIPLAYFYLAVGVLLILYNRSPQPGYMALAGLMSGFAAWTKNEGVVFLLAVIITLVIIFGLRKQRKDFIKILISFLLGLLLPLAVIIYFKWQLAPANDITSNQSLSIIVSKILDPQRYWIIFRYFGDIIYRLGEWDNPVIIAGLLYLFLFWDLGGQNRKGLWMATLVLVLTFAGYFSIYLITPHPLEWHLTYSVDRLVFHLFPMYLLIIFLATGTPEDLYEKITGSREEKRKALD